mgnify:FL=1
MEQKVTKALDKIQPVLDALPDNLRKIICTIPFTILKDLEEIRIRQNRPLMVYSRGKDYFIRENGEPTLNPLEAYCISSRDTQRILQLMADFSLYAIEEEIRNGYITLKGGYRVGLAGKGVIEGGKLRTLKYINSFNIRITREIPGVADKVLPFIIKEGNVLHTLILSPPQMGKTTLIRDIIRQISDGFPGFDGKKVGVVDERSEISGCYQGIPQNDVGIRTDILDACPKAIGITMLIRSMSPQVIATDEIGREEDVSAIEDALNAGIKIITTAHSNDLQDAMRRPILSSVLDKNIFERILVLGNSLGTGTLEEVYDCKLKRNILSKPIR